MNFHQSGISRLEMPSLPAYRLHAEEGFSLEITQAIQIQGKSRTRAPRAPGKAPCHSVPHNGLTLLHHLQHSLLSRVLLLPSPGAFTPQILCSGFARRPFLQKLYIWHLLLFVCNLPLPFSLVLHIFWSFLFPRFLCNLSSRD